MTQIKALLFFIAVCLIYKLVAGHSNPTVKWTRTDWN
jgi:hypothetical protein